MGFIANGMSLYGAAIAYSSTFFVFSDFMKPALRLAAIQQLPVIYVFTHDSFFVGEDGLTHEPIEQLAMLRSIPGMTVLRPAEAYECAHAWNYAITAKAPVALILTRQDLRPYGESAAKRIAIEKGAYVVSCEEGFEYILIGTGSELNLALDTAEELRKMGKKVRVVSMPSWELFLKQGQSLPRFRPSAEQQKARLHRGRQHFRLGEVYRRQRSCDRSGSLRRVRAL